MAIDKKEVDERDVWEIYFDKAVNHSINRVEALPPLWMEGNSLWP